MDWNKRIMMAKKRGMFTEDDMELANDWDTCKCGEMRMAGFLWKQQENPVEMTDSYAPVDHILAHLGACFSVVVRDNDVTKAEEIALKIERRIAVLMKKRMGIN